jgi:hypothetical protein
MRRWHWRAAQTLFWLYTFRYIHQHANPMGDGLDWIAIVPMTIIFLALVLPAFALCLLGLRYALATKIGAGRGRLYRQRGGMDANSRRIRA